MGQTKWYRRYPQNALTGMHGLTLEERGAYNTVLDLIYDRDDNLPDDDRFVAGWCGCDIRIWRRIKQRLIDLGKLTIEDGKIRNDRATCEVTYGLSRHLSASEAGRTSASKRWGKLNENNVVAITPVVAPVVTNQNQSKKKEEEEEKKENIKERAGAWKEGEAVPAEWRDEMAGKLGWTKRQTSTEADRFVDYALAHRKLYVDWRAAWRQWCRSPFCQTKKDTGF